MSRGKRGEYTQTGVYVKINNDLYKRLTLLPTWNSNKNQTINECIRLGLAQTEQDYKKQQEMKL